MEHSEFLNGGHDGEDGVGGGGSRGRGEDAYATGNETQRASGDEERPDTGRMARCISFLQTHVHYLPIVTAIFIVLSLLISYAVSVSQGHVEPDFPYISYTAVEVPERGIFAQLINVGACLMGANVYIRFLQQREVYKGHGHPVRSDPKDRRLVIASFICGCFSAFGLSMVANFQTIVMRPPHYVGAGLAFGMGLTYCWLQTSISLRHKPRGDGVTIAQLVISSSLTLFLLIFAVSKTIFKVKEHRGEGTREVELRGVYLVSTVSEWLTVIAVVVFVLTFCPDFSTLILEGPKVRFSHGRANREGYDDDHQLGVVSYGNHGTSSD